jgi:soluble lytic murein transglycosylase-like protein
MSLAELFCAAYISLLLPNADVACKYMPTIIKSSQENNVDASLMIALIHVESRWTPTARSASNACGLTQILSKYSGGFNERFGKKLTCEELYNPKVSIKRGTKILSYYLARYHNNKTRSLCAYNAGWTRCRNVYGTHKGYRYARKVLSLSNRIQKVVNSLR